MFQTGKESRTLTWDSFSQKPSLLGQHITINRTHAGWNNRFTYIAHGLPAAQRLDHMLARHVPTPYFHLRIRLQGVETWSRIATYLKTAQHYPEEGQWRSRNNRIVLTKMYDDLEDSTAYGLTLPAGLEPATVAIPPAAAPDREPYLQARSGFKLFPEDLRMYMPVDVNVDPYARGNVFYFVNPNEVAPEAIRAGGRDKFVVDGHVRALVAITASDYIPNPTTDEPRPEEY